MQHEVRQHGPGHGIRADATGLRRREAAWSRSAGGYPCPRGTGRSPREVCDGARTLVSVASPLSTGGAGTIYEYRVAAVVLAALLRGDRVIGLEVPVTEVRLQQRIAGSYLDDVI